MLTSRALLRVGVDGGVREVRVYRPRSDLRFWAVFRQQALVPLARGEASTSISRGGLLDLYVGLRD
ncbi:hypothetical protein K523DRAFT_323476 [Schizophyllum commune Tattone D]|nr:hypothetical protein K523DRAFT_323476 [Schizophyllum commune Tattone D]